MYKTRSSSHYFRAFTIVELLVVIVVIGILAAITTISYTNISSRALIASLTSDLANASKLLKIDQAVNGAYPATLSEANDGKGIPISAGNNYQYYYDNTVTPQYFCITISNNSIKYRITNDGIPTLGDCLDDGLILNLDAGNATSYPSPFNGVTWYDLSGLGNNGILNGGVSYVSDNGGVLNFDGVDDYVRVSGDSINAGNWKYEVATFSLWIAPSPTTSTADQNLITIEGAFEMAINNRNNGFSSVKYASMPWAWRGAVNNDIVNDNWNNLVYVHTLYNRKIYVNGSVVFTSNNTGGLSSGTTAYPYMTIGGRYAGTSSNTFGQINNVRIYNRALSSDEIAQNFSNLKDRYGL